MTHSPSKGSFVLEDEFRVSENICPYHEALSLPLKASSRFSEVESKENVSALSMSPGRKISILSKSNEIKMIQ
jgi:hypothetical protein